MVFGAINVRALFLLLRAFKECFGVRSCIPMETRSIYISKDSGRHASHDRASTPGQIAEPIGIDEMARHSGLSRSHFISLFHQETGTTPRRFIEDCRIGEATHLLRTRNLSAAEVAFACGFSDPPRFSRVFKNRTGLSPSDLRRKERSVPKLSKK